MFELSRRSSGRPRSPRIGRPDSQSAMFAAVHQSGILPQGLPAFVAVAFAAAALAAWVAAHFVGRRASSHTLRAGLSAARVGIGFVALMAAAQAAGQWLVLATNWPLWPLALAGSATVEMLLGLYKAEQSTIARRVGLTLAALRVGLASLVVLMLAQPVFVRRHETDLRRYVAVLVDGSASMQVPDTQLPVPDRIRIAEVLSPAEVRNPYRLDAAAEALDAAAAKLASQREWFRMLAEVDPDARRRHLEAHRQELTDALKGASETVAAQLKAMDDVLGSAVALSPETRTRLSDTRERLSKEVSERLRGASALAAGGGAPASATAAASAAQAGALPAAEAPLQEAIAAATDALGKLAPGVREIGKALDEAYYASLPEPERAVVDGITHETRFELARQLLFGRPAAGGQDGSFNGLLAGLRERYGVRAYTFASQPSDVDTARPEDVRAVAGAAALETDLAAALQRAATDIPSRQLAGVILLTDGRHNALARVESVARRLGLEHVPVCTVVIGSEIPPTDAAIVSLQAPETVYAGDKVYITAQVKLDGLAGRTVGVSLLRGDQVVQTQTVQVPSPQYRARVELSDTPAGTGLLAYRIRVDRFPDEVLADNNEYLVAVSVTDDQVRLLLVEDRPRWEFRYLRNLFASRDKTVRLQSVLFRPDLIAGAQERPRVAASVSRPAAEVEATDLPQDEQEWMKFDVIIVGDVSPSELPLAAQEALRRFVADRGGTLVVIAGPRFMPQAFAGMPLEGVLPVRFQPTSTESVATPDEGFRVALSPEGRDSVVLRLKPDPDENASFWLSRPEARWRYPITAAKPRAAVLAYARPTADAGGNTGAAPAADRDYQASHALIVVQNAALGRIVFLAYDETWRLRYREGDTYHHRLWGQLLRWATASKLPAGTNLVKLGTDQARYALHEPVQVRARIVQKDLTPVVSAELAARIYRDDQLVLRKRLEYIGDPPGTYVADLGELPSGTYRVELEGPQVQALLASEGAGKAATNFSVDPATSTEQVELGADRGLPGLLADLSGGVAVGPAEAARVMNALGPNVLALEDRREYALWDSWPLLVLMVGLATTEWLLRKKVGLP